ncbi:hypothetical protein CFB40_02450 [Burkholderia sp. AU31652]|uniref:hypothetical protein n=1 Tax=Burkholderia sp. AU31652 TaxID=2015354 RepID=UPI000B7A4C94|nr:hypothetical protein [Burkholderia sp. AU31652]OXI91591.1 hypothetical protein CFB40_02450 [Burkholderia sp. AU31652]
MGLFVSNTLTHQETAAVATLLVSAELAGAVSHHAPDRRALKERLGAALYLIQQSAGAVKTLGAIRQRSIITFAVMTASSLTRTVNSERLSYLSNLALCYEDMLLTSPQRCPDDLIGWCDAVAKELRQHRLL